MRKKLIIISTILLISISVAGNTFSWFSSSTNNSEETVMFNTIDVEVLDEDARVKSIGTGETYVRVRLIPQWIDHNLSVSNVILNLNSKDWTSKQEDGYYYFKYYLNKDQITSKLVEGVNFTSLPPEYEGKSFKLKVVAEGVQKNNKALGAVWEVKNLPFAPNERWTP